MHTPLLIFLWKLWNNLFTLEIFCNIINVLIFKQFNVFLLNKSINKKKSCVKNLTDPKLLNGSVLGPFKKKIAKELMKSGEQINCVRHTLPYIHVILHDLCSL